MGSMSYPPQPPVMPWAPAPPPRRRPRHPEAKLGPFTWRDLITVLAYALLMFLGLGALILFIPGVPELLGRDENAMIFAANLVSYAASFALVLWALGPELWRSFKTFRWYPWAKGFGVPGAWLVTIITSAVVVAIAASLMGINPEDINQSANQQEASELISAMPFALMLLMVVILGPLVEEFVFRHLLIGKLSRWINPWIMVVLSALLFMSLHFIGKEWPTPITAAPYVVMGLSFGAGYVLSGKSIGYAWVMHAFSNLMALSLSTLLAPYLPS
jgi:uncharacterized protein